jgi:hypothetical protein
MATRARVPARRGRTKARPAHTTLSHCAAADLRAAVMRFKNLPRSDQIAAAEMAVYARHGELRRAWPVIDSIGVGIRRRRDSRGRERHIPEICIVFTVVRKWRKGAGSEHPDKLPSHVWVSLDRSRRISGAIPTDVVSKSASRGMRPQAPQHLIRAKFPQFAEKATLACLIQVNAAPQLFALSCKHVLSAPNIFHGSPPASVLNDASGAPFGSSSVFAGTMGVDIISLDAQLAVISDLAGARATLSAIRFHSSAQSASDIPERFYVHQPSEYGNTPLSATFVQFRYHDFPLPYETPTGTVGIRHQMLVEYRLAQGVTRKGICGSAVSSNPAGGTFLGMHIAGKDDTPWGLFIPAWLLVDGGEYGLGAGSVLHSRSAADLG